MTLIYRTKDSKRYKHFRGSNNQATKPKPFTICRDYETMKINELAREKALQAYNAEKVDNKWRKVMLDTAEASVKQKISIWRATFERACDVMHNKFNDLMNQVKESDKQAQVLNTGFYEKVDSMNQKFYTDLAAMTHESDKRDVGFMKKSRVKKFMNDFNTLTRENEKRNSGFQCRNNKIEKEDKFKKMCEESRKRNNMYMNRRKFTELDRMNEMNECRTASFMAQRPESKFDAVMSMNDRRTAGFTNKKPFTKLEEITKWNGQRNAVFHLRA